MTRIVFSLGGIGIALLCLLHANPGQAQTRVFVAAQGSDANPCTFALPCRTFQHAHDTVPAGGEIDVLDPAGYGAVTISKAISIQGHGFAGISMAAASNGVTINAGATDGVSLNGLLIDGGGFGNGGIRFNSGKSLAVENCVVRNLMFGLEFISNATWVQKLSVSNSYFTDILNTSAITISTQSSGPVTAAIERTALYGNANSGLFASGSGGTGALNVAVTDSVAGGNNSVGFAAVSAAAHSPTSLVLTRVTAAGNSIGILAVGTNATLRLTQSTVTGNTTGYNASSGGVIFSYGDNTIDDNTGNTGSLTTATHQ